MPFTNPIVGGTALVRPAINSPDFKTGVSGWSINQPGSAEFNDLIARGLIIGDVQATSADPSDAVITASVTGDANSRLQILANGSMHFGDGTNPQDTALMRSAPGVINVGDTVTADAVGLLPSRGADTALTSTVGTESDPRVQMLGDGSWEWGDGSGDPDALLYRASAGQLGASIIVADVDGVPETWHAVALTSPWVNFGGTQQALRVRLMPDGTIWLNGDIKTTSAIAAGSTITTLSDPYLPGSSCVFPVTGAGIPAGATLNVDAGGSIQLNNFTGSITVALVGLTHVRFPSAGL